MSATESVNWFSEYCESKDGGAMFTAIKNKKVALEFRKLIKVEICVSAFPDTVFILCMARPDAIGVTKITRVKGGMATESVPTTVELKHLLLHLKDQPELTG
jgi:hypothetical protein